VVALSEFIMKTQLKRPRQRNTDDVISGIRLAIKPRYLGNHVSQIKSYYDSLSGSHVALSESVVKNRLKLPWRRTDDDVISGWQ